MIVTQIVFVSALVLFNIIYVKSHQVFNVTYDWSHINFTWKSSFDYLTATNQGKYISQNVIPVGVKMYKQQVFLAFPKWLNGVPATLAYFKKTNKSRTNIPLIPYPSWEDNNADNCSNLVDVQSMEIDASGIMWIIDSIRSRFVKACPCKLVLLDLNQNGRKIHFYTFPEEICKQNVGNLNDIVVDDTDGGYAYITDSSSIDPGLIIYSKAKNKSWKIRDTTMFASEDAPKFKVDGQFASKGNVNGIALSPKTKLNYKRRDLFYSVLTGYNIYSIPTNILRNETICKTNHWKKSIKLVLRKQGSSGGMMCDNRGNLFYTLQSLNAIGQWNIYKPVFTSRKLYQNNKTLIWPDSFSMDNIDRDIYILSNHAISFLNPLVNLDYNAIKFRLSKYHTGSRSYVF